MSGTRYVVSRYNWRRSGDGWVRLPGEVPVGSFPTAEAAAADRDRREAAARAAVNPFRCGGPAAHYWTSLDEPRLRDWLTDHDLTPPADGDWPAWWDGLSVSDSQRAGVWAALDRLTFFAVAERTGAVGYAVVRINWEYNDEYNYCHPEGGSVMKVYRDRAKADAACRVQIAAARQEWERMFLDRTTPIGEDNVLDVSNREKASADPFGKDQGSTTGGATFVRPDDAPFFEVVEVELEGTP